MFFGAFLVRSICASIISYNSISFFYLYNSYNSFFYSYNSYNSFFYSYNSYNSYNSKEKVRI
ncbi:hypothetical protein CCP3SC1AL1_680013 [Gammaproteobacteria bacterium]